MGYVGGLYDDLNDTLAAGGILPKIVQRVRPDVLLLNELDFDGARDAQRLLETLNGAPRPEILERLGPLPLAAVLERHREPRPIGVAAVELEVSSGGAVAVAEGALEVAAGFLDVRLRR